MDPWAVVIPPAGAVLTAGRYRSMGSDELLVYAQWRGPGLAEHTMAKHEPDGDHPQRPRALSDAQVREIELRPRRGAAVDVHRRRLRFPRQQQVDFRLPVHDGASQEEKLHIAAQESVERGTPSSSTSSTRRSCGCRNDVMAVLDASLPSVCRSVGGAVRPARVPAGVAPAQPLWREQTRSLRAQLVPVDRGHARAVRGGR